MAAYLIARAKKLDTIDEESILPIPVKILEIVNGKEYSDVLKKFRCQRTLLIKE